MTGDQAPALLRIGALSRRLGLSEHVLRAWERRYGVLQPVRSAGGFRLYSEADERRVRRMQTHMARGLSAAEAAAAALGEDEPAPQSQDSSENLETTAESRGGGLSDRTAALARPLDGMDEPRAQAALDRLFTQYTLELVLRDVVIPYLHELGERWKQGRVSVAQEHFASNVLRGRLAGLARGWGNGTGPQAVLACPPGEQHDLALLMFGIVLHHHGWRIAYLGTNTPFEELDRTVAETPSDLVVLAATTPERFDRLTEDLARLARAIPIAVAGAGATPAVANAIGATLLTTDPVTAAEQIATSPRRSRLQPPG
jgi:MerR family transcriptional regulator, light-induced transcriptional regulator